MFFSYAAGIVGNDKTDIKNIIDAFLATAGLNTNSNNDLLKELGYDTTTNTALNDLQKAVITQKFTNALVEVAKEFAGSSSP